MLNNYNYNNYILEIIIGMIINYFNYPKNIYKYTYNVIYISFALQIFLFIQLN